MTLSSADAQKTQEIISYIGSRPSDWYVGIASDPRARLFVDHSVKEQVDSWIFRTFPTSDIARAIEQHLIDKLGADGGPGGGDHTTRAVYAYRKGPHTLE